MSWRSVQAVFSLGVVAMVALAVELHARFIAPEPFTALQSPGLWWWGLFTTSVIAVGYAVGLPEMPRSRSEVLQRGMVAVVSSLALVSLAQLLLAEALLPRSSLLILMGTLPAWFLVAWNFATDAEGRGADRDRVLVIAEQLDQVGALAADLAAAQEVPAQLAGSLSVEDARVRPDGRRPLLQLAAEMDATVLVLDRAAQDDESIVSQVVDLHRQGIRVRTLALFYEGWLGKLPVAELAQVSLLFDIGELHRARYVRAKRVFDVGLGLLGAVALAALLPLIILGNLVANRGPLFFRQVRVGKAGVPFEMLKFRTMRTGDAAHWTAIDDDRITPFGAALRKLHLDELPQVINVLRGELSIVGPRPEQVAYVEELCEKIPFYDARHIVRPGLTGWAQVKFGYASSEADALEKLQYDFYYLRRQGLMLDVRIVVRTVREVVGFLGR